MPLLLWGDIVALGAIPLHKQQQAAPRYPHKVEDDDDVLAFAWVWYLRHYYSQGQPNEQKPVARLSDKND